MTENGKKLKELKDGLEDFIREHSETLSHEPAIRHPLDDAAKEARRKFNMVNDGPAHPLGLSD